MFTFFTPKFYLSCILNITSLGFIFAEEQLLEPMVVVESRTPQSLNETSPWVTRISVYELEERQIDNLADALRSVPGMAVFRSGQAGSQTSLFRTQKTTFVFEVEGKLHLVFFVLGEDFIERLLLSFVKFFKVFLLHCGSFLYLFLNILHF